jgi:topoisomerase-4 subunit B
MGKNTPSRQEFIIGNLRVEKDEAEEEAEETNTVMADEEKALSMG